MSAPETNQRGRARRLRFRPWTAPAVLLTLGALGLVAAEPSPGLVEQPLAPRSGPTGATMFATLPADQTGVRTENRYADPKMWWERKEEFKFGSIGTGIAVGDFDRDGRPDLFVVSKTETSRLFRNLGNWKFEDVTDRAGLTARAGTLAEGVAWLKRTVGQAGEPPPNEAWGHGATFVDFDNDGWLDLYVCRYNAPNLLYVNQHDGTFKEEAAAHGLAIVDASVMAAFADYDRDGSLDVYLCTNILDGATKPAGQRDYLLHNDGRGHFTDVTAPAGITGENQAHSATWWDHDNDGWPDVYVANDFVVPDSLYHNNRDGTFTNRLDQTVPHTPHSSMGADLGDVNNDGLIDFFVADMAATTHEKDQRGMARIRALLTNLQDEPGVAAQYMRSTLFLNTGVDRLLEAAPLAGIEASDWTWAPRWEDFDNDGRLDLFATNGMVRELHNVDLNERMAGTESQADAARLMQNSPALNEPNLAFRNVGELRFESVGPAWGLDRKGVSFGSATGDFDGDGDLDVVVANYQDGPTVLRNDSAAGHRVIVELRGTRSNRFGVGAVVQLVAGKLGVQTRSLVLARGYASSSEPSLHFGLGDESRIDQLTIVWPSGTLQTLSALAVDRKYIVTEPEGAPAKPALQPAGAVALRRTFVDVSEAQGLAWRVTEATNAPEIAQPLLPFRQNRRGPALAVGDLNGDGEDDVILGGTPAEPARILLAGTTNGTYLNAGDNSLADGSPLADGPVLVFDANGDGSNDVLLARSGASLPAGAPGYASRLFRNDGRGGLGRAGEDAWPSLPISVGAMATADFDRNGQLDVFVGGRVVPGRYPLPAPSVLLANRDGRFENVTEALAPGLREPGLVTSALWSDVDGDDWPDLIIALEWGGVRYFHNEAGKGFVDRSEAAGFEAAGRGWWSSLASADFNGDGRPDYVLGNAGENTPYHPDRGHPALLYHGVFGQGGGPQLVEAYYEGERLYPRRSRNEFAPRLPEVMRRYPRNDLYARATLDQIFGADRLAAAQRFAADELRSGVLLSQAGGTFQFSALARIAQIAPLQGLLAGDFDGDGQADIYAVQNSYAPNPVIGRFDGGLSQLLLGDGRGGFTAVPPAQSGLIVPGNAKALVALDLNHDGWADFVVSRNNETTLAFQNSPTPGRNALRISLTGPRGNGAAVGARVTVELANGRTQTAEVSAGAGYFSQTSASCWFGYTDANPARRIRVRWPDGRSTVEELTKPPSHLRLTAP